MQNCNNLLVASAFVLLLFLALVPAEWFRVASLGISNNGLTGSLGFPNTPKVPIWLLLGVSAFAVAVAILNLLRITSIPRFVPALGQVICGAYYALPLSITEDHFSVKFSATPFIAIAATLAGLGVLFFPSASQPNPTIRRTAAGEDIISLPHF